MKPPDLAKILNIPDLPKYLKQVEAALDKATAIGNPYMRRPIKRLIHAKGKRLRPSLILAISHSQNKKIDQTIINACVAVELVHVASLVHDDIMDKAHTRWGAPTINAQEGDNLAIVIGDYLFTEAGRQAAKISPEMNAIIADAIVALCDGQSRELADQFNLNRTMDSYLHCIKGKTATLFAASCRIGAISAGMKPKEIKALAGYGENFGMAFQIIDDVLDFVGDPKITGKPVGNDVKEGVYTLPLILASNQEKRQIIATSSINQVYIDKSLREAERYAKSTSEQLQSIFHDYQKLVLS